MSVEEQFRQAEELRRITEAKAQAARAGTLESRVILTEVEAISSEVYGLIKPMVEQKRKLMLMEQEIVADLGNLNQKFGALSNDLQNLSKRLDILIDSRSANAADEARMLAKLNNIL